MTSQVLQPKTVSKRGAIRFSLFIRSKLKVAISERSGLNENKGLDSKHISLTEAKLQKPHPLALIIWNLPLRPFLLKGHTVQNEFNLNEPIRNFWSRTLKFSLTSLEEKRMPAPPWRQSRDQNSLKNEKFHLYFLIPTRRLFRPPEGSVSCTLTITQPPPLRSSWSN